MGVGAGLYMCDVVKKFTFAISSPDEFLSNTSYNVAVSCRVTSQVSATVVMDGYFDGAMAPKKP